MKVEGRKGGRKWKEEWGRRGRGTYTPFSAWAKQEAIHPVEMIPHLSFLVVMFFKVKNLVYLKY